MKIQTTKPFLAIALLGVWGLVGYQLYQKFGPKEDFIPTHHQSYQQTEVQLAESFKLLVNYRDPFLEERLKRKTAMSSAPLTVNVAPRKAATPAKKPVFPKVLYKGNIKMDNGREVALVNINGKTVHLAEQEKHQELKMIQIYEDSIKMNFQGVDKVIPKFSVGK